MSYVKCQKCMKEYSSFLKLCPYCNKYEVFGEATYDSNINKRKSLEVRMLNICNNFFDKNNDEYSNDTINKSMKLIDEYINKLEYIYDEENIKKMFCDYTEYLNSLTYDYYSSKHFKTRDLKSGKYVVGFNDLDKIGQNTEIIFPKDTVGIKGKKERYYDHDLEKYDYVYPPILENIKCKLLLFPENYELIDGVFRDITVSVATKDNLNVDINRYEVSLDFHKVCPETPFFPSELYRVGHIIMKDLRPELNIHLYTIPAYDEITIINSYIHKNYAYCEPDYGYSRFKGRTKYHFHNTIDFLQDSSYIAKTITKDNGVIDVDLSIKDLKKYYNYGKRLLRIPMNLEKVVIPSELFSNLDHSSWYDSSGVATTFKVEGSTIVDTIGGGVNIIDFDEIPSYVPPYISQVYIQGRLVKDMTGKDVIIDAKDFDEYLLVAKHPRSLFSKPKVIVKIGGKLFDNIIDFPGIIFKDESCFISVGEFEKVVVYPENFNKKCPVVETKILVLKDGIEEFVYNRDHNVEAECVTLSSTLKNDLNSITYRFFHTKSIEIPSLLIKEDAKISFTNQIETVVIFGDIRVVRFRLFFDSYRKNDGFLVLNDKTIMIPKEKTKETVVVYENGRIIVNN